MSLPSFLYLSIALLLLMIKSLLQLWPACQYYLDVKSMNILARILNNNIDWIKYPGFQMIQTLPKKKKYKRKINDPSSNGEPPLYDLPEFPHDILEPINDLIQQWDLKKLKVVIKQFDKGATNISVKYGLKSPLIMFEYVDSNNNWKRQSLTQILRIKKDLKSERKLINKTFGSIYRSVPHKYHQMFKIPQIFVKQKKKPFYFDEKDEYLPKHFQAYYTIVDSEQEKQINFLFFDLSMNYMELTSSEMDNPPIEKLGIYPLKQTKYYKMYKKFIHNQIWPQLINQNHSLSLNTQIDSDDEFSMANSEDFSVAEALKSITKFIEKEEELEDDEIEAQENEKKLSEFLKSKQAIIKQFKISNHNPKILKACLKKIRLAKKQLKSKLKVLLSKSKIIEKFQKSNILILEGETGSGKSTQIPQILAEYLQIFDNEEVLPILITEPRKLAARSLAERVAEELGEKDRSFVDYQTRDCADVNPQAKIIFKIDRLVLNQLKEDPLLSKYSSLVIDQAHERTMGIDVILGMLVNILKKRPGFKVIIMSASMNADLFHSHFSKQFNVESIKIPGCMHQVTEIYKPYTSQLHTVNKIKRIINDQILNENKNMRPQYRGHVLVFCESVSQIQLLVDNFKKQLNDLIFRVLPLHGKLSQSEQKTVFSPTQYHKIIFATRIAETSITIQGIKVVVDPGLDFEETYNHKTKVLSMQLIKISKSSAKQRSGRAGRTSEGFCFRLYTNDYLQNQNKTPQIKNMPLDIVVLRLKSLNIQNVYDFPYVQAPHPNDLQHSEESLKLLGCLNAENTITSIGQFLIQIPIQPLFSRAILQAIIFEKFKEQFAKDDHKKRLHYLTVDLVADIINIFSLLSYSSYLFNDKFISRERATKNKFEQYSNFNGDFSFFRDLMETYQTKPSNPQQKNSWLTKLFLSKHALNQAKQLAQQIKGIIGKIDQDFVDNLTTIEHSKYKFQRCQNIEEAILCCLLTSFGGNICVYSGDFQVGYTCLSSQLPVRIYGTSLLQIKGCQSKWIIAQNFYQNSKGQNYCKIAQQIDYQFLIKNLDPMVIQKYKIKEINEKEFFYQIVQKTYPTYFFQTAQGKIMANKENPLKYDNGHHYVFDDDYNKVKVFMRRKTPKLDQENKKMIMKELESYQKLQTQDFRHNYIGAVDLILTDGLKIKDINFDEANHFFIVKATKKMGIEFQKYFDRYGQIQVFEDHFKFYLNERTNLQQFQEKLERYIEYWCSTGQQASYKPQIANKKYRVPEGKLSLKFWAGKYDKNCVYLYFPKNSNLQFLRRQLQKGIHQASKENDNFFRNTEMSETLKKDGLVFSRKGKDKEKSLDEFEVQKKLDEMMKKGYLGYGFEMPKIIKYRDPIPKIESVNWQNQIKNLLKKLEIDSDKCLIKVQGKLQKNMKNSMARSPVYFKGSIFSDNMQSLQKFVDKYDQQECLGTQKLHACFQYQCTAVLTQKFIFQNCTTDYQFVRDNYKEVKFLVKDKIIKNVCKKLIIVMGKNQQSLLKPAKELQLLFSPKTIRDKQIFNYLYNYEKEGDEILDSIEAKHGYKIKIFFDRHTESINIYGDDKLAELAIADLKNCLERQQIPLTICYRGKSLNRIIEIIQNFKALQQPNSKRIRYSIKYKNRAITIFCKSNISKSLQLEVDKVSKYEEAEEKVCQICESLVIHPYKLLHCQHNFCWICLSGYLRELNFDHDKIILECPSCSHPINVLDIQNILSFEQFSRLCDSQLIRFLEASTSYRKCFSKNCENIFQNEEAELNGYFDCSICGIWYCTKCKEPHKGIKCEEWKRAVAKAECNLKMKINH